MSFVCKLSLIMVIVVQEQRCNCQPPPSHRTISIKKFISCNPQLNTILFTT